MTTYTKPRKYAKNTNTGEIFIGIPDREWHAYFATWKKDTSKPSPMPEGHLMFDGRCTNYKPCAQDGTILA